MTNAEHLQHEWIHDIEFFKKIISAWDSAVQSAAPNNPFLMSDFIISWWNHFSKSRKLCILTLWQEKELIGGLPLYLKSYTPFFKRLKYVGDIAANYTEPFSLYPYESILPVIYNALETLKNWDDIDLPQVRNTHPFALSVAKMNSTNPYSVKIQNTHLNWAINMRDAPIMLSKKLRTDIRSKKRLAESAMGTIRIERIQETQNLADSFDEYIELSCKSFESRNKKSIFKDKRLHIFFKELFVHLSKKKYIQAHRLYAGDQLLAITFAYVFPDEFGWVLTCFNYKLNKYRPGYLLIEELTNDIKKQGISYFNWYGHESFYKRQWCNYNFPLARVQIYKDSLKIKTLYSIASLVHENPKIKKIIKHVTTRFI